jgi:proteasome assembly chaperone (PAC2) family protein
MKIPGLILQELPRLQNPVLIAGFDGWGNALNVSNGMLAFLIRHFQGGKFASLDPDTFYRYDEQRPVVDITDGKLKSMEPPGGSFFVVRTDTGQDDLILLKANEPNLQWYKLVDMILSVCREFKVNIIISLGSMYDNVLHTDRIVSGIASAGARQAQWKKLGINPISYQGPSAIHSIIHSEGVKNGIECMSLWSHCPYYLQGTTHFGMLSYLSELISDIIDINLDNSELRVGWHKLEKQIETLIEGNSEIQTLINDLRKEKVKGTVADMRGGTKSDEKIINLQDFLDPK